MDVAADDPLDAAGTTRRYSADRTSWAAVWSRFPMYADKPKLRMLMTSLRDNAVTIIVSGTGSGKTVVCPPLVLTLLSPTVASSKDRRTRGSNQSCVSNVSRVSNVLRVAVTIPKRVTALGAATTAARTLDVPLGGEVGYRYRGAPAGSYDRKRTRLVYATDGTLLAQARHDPWLREYAAVVVDEAHERSVSTDMLLLALRRCMVARPEFRVVVMSATIDPTMFRSYFSPVGKVGLVEVAGGTMHPVRRIFTHVDSTPDGYMADGVTLATKLLVPTASDPGNALFFVATTREAGQGCRAFHKVCHKGCDAIDCTGLYSKQSPDAQTASLAPVGPPFIRKLMFATNVAESSLTFHNLTTVLDGGYELNNTWDPMAHGSSIEKVRITKAQALQRIGRVGRTSPGTAYMLYTNKTFDAMPDYPKPAILMVDLTEHVLVAMATRGSNGLAAVLADFGSMITPPTPATLTSAVSLLHFYRLVDVCSDSHRMLPFKDIPYGKPNAALVAGLDGCVTRHGRLLETVMSRLKMGLWNALLVVAGVVYGCPEDAGTLACMFEATAGELSSLFIEKTPGKKTDLRHAFPSAADARSDHRSLLHIYRKVLIPILEDGGETSRTRTAIAKAGLAYGPWRNVHDRVRHDLHTIARLKVPSEVIADCPLYRIRDKAGIDPLERAITAARMYHHVGANGVTTATPERLHGCVPDPDFAQLPATGRPLVYEQLLHSGGRRRLLTITYLSQPSPVSTNRSKRAKGAVASSTKGAVASSASHMPKKLDVIVRPKRL